MELDEFLTLVPDFGSLSDTEQVKHFAWFVYRHRGKAVFDTAVIRACYVEVGIQEPKVSREISRLYDRKQILKVDGGYRLERSERETLDKKYGDHQSTIVVKQLLLDLPGKVSDANEKTFLREAIDCYKVKAYRAATVMSWNLAYDHLLTWIVAKPERLTDFNGGIDARLGAKRAGTVRITKRDNFEDLTEREVLDIAAKTDLIADNMKKVLVRGLDDRNLAAHPSGIEIDQPNADSTIYSLVTNVVLKL
jgi:hypothetical protein